MTHIYYTRCKTWSQKFWDEWDTFTPVQDSFSYPENYSVSFSDSFIQIMSVIIENLTEDNVTEFIIRYLGKPRINNETLYPLTFIYSSFLLLGLLGNLATCIVILNNEYMKSPTNVYLINLAVADIATLLLGNKILPNSPNFAKNPLFTHKIHRNTIFNTIYFNFRNEKTY